jgi:predicted TIM-barrel fold metal-dependent hydrolase
MRFGTSWVWPYQTSVAMARLVFSGITDHFPELKIVVHHLGAMIPYFAERAGAFLGISMRPYGRRGIYLSYF